VYVLHHGVENIGVALWSDPVAEVENVARMTGVRGKNVVGRGDCGITSGENRCRVEVALKDDIAADTPTHLVDAHRLVDAEHRCSCFVHRFEKMRTANAEVDSRNVGVQALQFRKE
jgi:hypothetical protein